MAQDWVSDLYEQSYDGDTTMQNIEKMFATLKSLFSGGSAPSNPVAGMPWFDTTKTLLKHRNNANNAWRGIMAGSASFKIWVYRNAIEDGWAIDATITDRVIAIKGGSQAYNVAGGTLAGSWIFSGITTANESSHTHPGPNHNHQWYNFINASTDQSFNSGGGGQSINGGSTNKASDYFIKVEYNQDPTNTPGDAYTSNASGTTGAGSAHNHGVNHNGNDRPAAAVGVMMYPDV